MNTSYPSCRPPRSSSLHRLQICHLPASPKDVRSGPTNRLSETWPSIAMEATSSPCAQCSPAATRPRKVTFPCYIQPKLSGVRALYQIGHFQSPHDDHLRPLTWPLSKIFDATVILDGVLYVHGWPAEKLKEALASGSEEVEYHVFDVVNFRRPFDTRFVVPASILMDTAAPPQGAESSRRTGSPTPTLVDYYYNQWSAEGYAGLIYRLNFCSYVPGKNHELLHRENDRTMNSPRPNHQLKTDPMSVDEILTLMRTLRTSQVRKQLEDDEKHNVDRLFCVYHFFRLAKEKQ